MSNRKLYRAVAQAMLAIGFAAGVASIAAAAQINPGGSPPPPPPPSQPTTDTKKKKSYGGTIRGHKVDHEETTRGLKARKKTDKGGSEAPADAGLNPK